MTIIAQVDKLVRKAALAQAKASKGSISERARMLRALARALESRREEVIALSAQETALTPQELQPEFDRMVGTLRLFAKAIVEGSWHVPIIDTKVRPSFEARTREARARQDDGTLPLLVGPNHDVRRTMVPRGPVVGVFGASNFPLAYGVLGGDTASALAAGAGVVVKEHPAHPRTGRLIHAIASKALRDAGMDGVLVYVQNTDASDTRAARALIAHEHVCAVGFTGSTRGGRAIETLCQQRAMPIPAFCEMGSCNVVYIGKKLGTPALARIVEELAESVIARMGQQCTKPGLVLAGSAATARALYQMFGDRFEGLTPRRMLSMGVAKQFYDRLDAMVRSNEVSSHTRLPSRAERRVGEAAPVALFARGVASVPAPTILEEAFGPAIVIATLRSGARHPASLTGAIYAAPDDVRAFGQPSAGGVGRLVASGTTTGVRVAHAMVHGGPWPATNAPETTAVGPLAIARWCRPMCYQNFPDASLPQELQDANPLGWMRLVNGAYTRARSKRL